MRDHFILGSKVTDMSQAELFEQLDGTIARQDREAMLNTNVHGIFLEHQNPWLRDLRHRARITYCDGAGILLAAALLGLRLNKRLCINDFFWPLAAHCAERGYKMFFLGARPHVISQAAENVCKRYRTLLAGYHHGYFEKAGSENEAILQAINAAKPNLLLIGFGMPLQEQWVEQNLHRLAVNVVLVVGGLFDRLSGSLPMAPRWMSDNGLEWLYLSAKRPQRFLFRYLFENPWFVGRVLMERFRHPRIDRISTANDPRRNVRSVCD
jgi:N-acetylglucosaminyldiphosphoundecaprenol N-acetyl-beta-D-mannosaminyltransferase